MTLSCKHSRLLRGLTSSGGVVVLMAACWGNDPAGSSGAGQAPTPIWTNAAVTTRRIPLVDAERVYFVDLDHHVAGVDKRSGTTDWRITLNSASGTTEGYQAFVDGDALLVGDQSVHRIDKRTGTVLWEFSYPGVTSPGFSMAYDNGTVYTGSGNGMATAIDSRTAAVRWVVRLTSDTRAIVRVGNPMNGRLFATVGNPFTRKGDLVALDVATGAILWQRPSPIHRDPNGSTDGPEPLAVGNLVLASPYNGALFAFDPATGAQIWKADPVLRPDQDPFYTADIREFVVCGNVIYSGSDLHAVALELQTGKELWRAGESRYVNADEVACDERSVWVMSAAGHMEVLDAKTGKLKWRVVNTRDAPFAAFAATFDGDRVYTGGLYGVYAFPNK